MADQNFLIMNLLRIITPEEISEMTTTYAGKKKALLTDLLENIFLGHTIFYDKVQSNQLVSYVKLFHLFGDGVLPEDISEDDNYIDQCGEEVMSIIKKNLKRDRSDQKVIMDELKDSLLDEKGRQNNTSQFIINEKQKFVNANRKLKGQKVFATYKGVGAKSVQHISQSQQVEGPIDEKAVENVSSDPKVKGNLIDKKVG